MRTGRFLFSLSLIASVNMTASADLVQQTNSSDDRLEQLTKTLSQGSFGYTDQSEIGEISRPIELNNESLNKKYPASTSRYTSNSVNSWLVTHPLPAGKVSSSYGGRTMGGRAENHSGLDLSAPTGTPIYATGPGIVTKSGWGNGYGQYVEINHGNGYITRYAHASRLVARVGDKVSAGEHIANVGCTGRCTGPHLHYEVVKDGQRKNPSTYLAMLP